MSKKKFEPIKPKAGGRRWVPVDMAAIRDMCRRGASNRQVAEKFALSYGTACRRCAEAREALEMSGIHVPTREERRMAVRQA